MKNIPEQKNNYMSIWFNKNISLADFNSWGNETMGDHIGIEFISIGDDFLKARMPVDSRTRQPYGLLHGGASAALAETIGSVASALVIDHQHYLALGVEINANHLRSVQSGYVIATCKPLQLGNTLHVWEIRIIDEHEHLICIGRLTVLIKKRK